MSGVYLALVHHPVVDRAGDVITTAVTNLDVHDIARSARTYDLAGYYVVTPIEAQHRLVDRILGHWRDGAGATRVPERSEALALCRLVDSVAQASDEIVEREGKRPEIWVTSARASGDVVDATIAGARMREVPSLILFGTGHGLAPALLEACDGVVAAIRGGGSYNHLSVRAAVAITLDRLFGEQGANPAGSD